MCVKGIQCTSVDQHESMFKYIIAILRSFIGAGIATIIRGFKDEV